MLKNCLFLSFLGWALTLLPTVLPKAVLLSENNVTPENEQLLMPGEEYVGAAPLEFRFSLEMKSSDNYRYEWMFSRDASFSDVFLNRFEPETIYCFSESGTFFVKVLVTDTSSGGTYESDSFIIRIAESKLEVPNAFSPNGDGVNDVFKVTHKSLIKFNAYVFNRWGQELYRWGLGNIDVGWDGTSKGKQVPEGVYFIVIEAEGADKVVYRKKGDINVLR